MEEIQKVYFSINEVANQLSVSTALIRFWEKELNLHLAIRKGTKKIRKYRKEHIDKLFYIKKLIREDKYTLQGVRDVLKKKQNLNSNKEDLINNIEKAKKILISLKEKSANKQNIIKIGSVNSV